jgi:hypothetical protein
MTCKNCLFFNMCYVLADNPEEAEVEGAETDCSSFADRSRYVVREKGEWEIREDSYGNELMWCPFCHEEFYDGENDTVDHTPNFCPNCGADMRGAVNNG